MDVAFTVTLKSVGNVGYKIIANVRNAVNDNRTNGRKRERKMRTDISKELYTIAVKLSDMIAQEQNAAIDNALVDAYDNIEMALKLLCEQDYAEF